LQLTFELVSLKSDAFRNSGFEVGSTTQACTKGIWMWNKPIYVNEQVDAVLLDTEGLGSTERSTNTDTKIFSLCILLSSLFIFNSIGPINEQAIEDLVVIEDYLYAVNQTYEIKLRKEGYHNLTREDILAKGKKSILDSDSEFGYKVSSF